MPGKRRLKKHEVKNLMGVKTDAERLIEWLQSDVDDIHPRMELPPTLQIKLERITTAKSLLLQHKFVHKVQKMLMKHYGYTIASAMRDLNLMTQVFGPLLSVTRDMRKAIAEEMIRQDREMDLEMKDTKALNMTTSNYIKLFGLDKDEADLPDFSKFEFHQNIIAVLPEQVGENPPEEEVLLQRVQDWINNVEDIDHEDVQGA
jgi:hypothetical protein